MAGDGHIGAGNHDELGQGEEFGERRKEGRRGGRRQEGVTVAPLLKSKDLHAPWLQVSEKKSKWRPRYLLV